MRDDEDYNGTTKGPEGLAKIVIFALIGMVMITSFALPLLANLGEQTTTETNTGIKMSCLTPEKWGELTSDYDTDGSLKLMLASTGFYISGRIDGTFTMRFLIHSEDYDTSYPILFTYINQVMGDTIVDNECMYSFSTDTNKYTSTNYYQNVTSSTIILNPPIDQETTFEIWYQDPNGTHIMNTGDMNISGGSVLGITIKYGDVVLVSTLDEAKYFNGGLPVYGEPTVDRATHSGYSTIESIGYSGTDCTYYIGPQTYISTDNFLDGTSVGAMIGVIPLLLAIGIVLYVARSVRGSDR